MVTLLASEIPPKFCPKCRYPIEFTESIKCDFIERGYREIKIPHKSFIREECGGCRRIWSIEPLMNGRYKIVIVGMNWEQPGNVE